MKYQPDEEFRKHLNQQGVRGKRFKLNPKKHAETLAKFRDWHPEETDSQLEQRVAHKLIWDSRRKHNAKWYLKWLAIGAALLLMILAGSSRAEAQVDCTYWKDVSGTTVGNFCAPFSVRSGNGLAAEKVGSSITLTNADIKSDLNTLYLRDDFIGTSANYGELNWKYTALGGGSLTIAQVAYDGWEPGIISLVTDAVAGHGGVIDFDSLGSTAPLTLNSYIFDSQFRFLLSATTNVRVNVGFQSAAGLNPGTSFYLRYDTNQSDTAFKFVVGANTVVSSGVLVDTNWHTLRIRATTAGTILMSLDGGTESSFASGIPTAAQFPVFLIESDTTAAKQMNVGAFSLSLNNLGRSLEQLTYAWNAFGDSVGMGFYAGTREIGGFAYRAAAHFGYRAKDYGRSGGHIGDWAFDQYGSTVVVAGSQTSIAVMGIGDQGFIAGDAAKLAAWKVAARANLLFGAISTTDKVKGNTFSFTGSWAAVSSGLTNYDNWGGKQTSSAAATATTSLSGTALYLVYLDSTVGDASFTVSIDGVSQGSFTNTGNSVAVNCCGITQYPVALRFTGFSSGSHTLVVTYSSGTTPLAILWAAGNTLTSHPRFIAGNCIPLQTGNTANLISFNAVQATTVSELLADGLAVYEWDANTAMDTTHSWLWVDSVHPSNAGHLVLANSAIAIAVAHP